MPNWKKCKNGSGWISLTIWEQQFGLLVNGRTYEVGPLQVKKFGEKYLAATSKMSRSETAPILDEELILAIEDQVIEAQGYTAKSFEKFAFADNFIVAFVCGKCKRKSDVSTMAVIQCPSLINVQKTVGRLLQ